MGQVLDPSPVSAFCAELKEFRRACGRDLVGLAREISVSRAQLYAVLNGEVKRPPDWSRLVEPLLRACGATELAVAEWRRRHDVLVSVYEELRRRDRRAAVEESAAHLGPVVPAQLPATVRAFSGRAAELARLDHLLPATLGAAVVICAVSGTAGVGKTALAVHWAHRVAARFPDGQLYVNLRGFGPEGRVTQPAEAVRGFLDALGVSAARVHTGLDAQVALYRSMLAGRRILVVLDNARDAEQVRPLLPGTPGGLVLVTSRHQLTGLSATDGAHLLPLDVLTDAESRELLRRRLGGRRTVAEPAAVEQIIAACARLPLALNIAAARAEQTGFPLAALATELGTAGDVAGAGERLSALDAGGPASDVRAVFSWSYAALGAPAAQLFRLLALHPGPDVSVAAAASLAGCPRAQARGLLTELARASLLAEHRPGRYAGHDLLRDYAGELTAVHDADDTRQAALTRLLDHYAHTAHAADRVLFPTYDPYSLPLVPVAPGARPEDIAGRAEATAWFDTEQAVLVAAVRAAADAGFDRHAWQLARSLNMQLDGQGRWDAREAAWHIALAAAERLDAPTAQSYAYQVLSNIHLRFGSSADAHDELQRALVLSRRAGDRLGEAHALGRVAMVLDWDGRPEDALTTAQQALAIYREIGRVDGEADSLNQIGWYHALLGRYREALELCGRALPLLQQVGDVWIEAATWDSLGYAHSHLGEHAEAVRCYHTAVRLFRQQRDREYEATTLARLGDAQRAAGDDAAAEAAWRQALDTLDDLGHGQAEQVREKLADLRRSRAAA